VLQQPEGTAPAWRAMYDGHDRMVVAVNYDTDIGMRGSMRFAEYRRR